MGQRRVGMLKLEVFMDLEAQVMNAFQREVDSCQVEMPCFNGGIHEVRNLRQTLIYNLQQKTWLGVSLRREGIL